MLTDQSNSDLVLHHPSSSESDNYLSDSFDSSHINEGKKGGILKLKENKKKKISLIKNY